MFRSLLLVSVLLSACASSDDGAVPDTTSGDTATGDTATGDTAEDTASGTLSPADLVGDWSSTTCEAYPDGNGGTNYLTRAFSLTDTRWALEFTIYGDADCTYGLFRGEIEGPYTLGEAAIVAGATEGDFAFASNRWTALTEDMAAVFEGAACASGEWEVGVPQDVTGTGCLGVAHPIAECPVEYDIVSVDGDALFFGARVTDMCVEEGRPTALAAYAVVRQ